MGKIKTPNKIIDKIKELRSKGYSISEISSYTGKSRSVVSKYIQNVKILPEFVSILNKKQGGSKSRSDDLWLKSNIYAEELIKKLTTRDKLILLIGIYWGEGTKRELNIINSDPIMLLAFIKLLKEIGVSIDRVKASVRIYENMSEEKTINYWYKTLEINKSQFYKTEVVKGNKKGKLEFGMCRLRVEKSSKEFKLIMSLISVVKKHIMLL